MSQQPARKPAASRPVDALKLLMVDHREVKRMFTAYEDLTKAEAADDEKHSLALQICNSLKVHMQVEEEFLYPAAALALDDVDLVDEAIVEHAGAKDLIEQIESMEPSEHLYDAKVKVLGEYIEHHVKEEEKEMFPELRKSDIDLKAIGASMHSRKEALMSKLVAIPAASIH